MSEQTQRWLIKGSMIIAGAVSYWFAVGESQSLVVLLLTSYGVIAQLAPPIVVALFWRRATTTGAFVGLVAGSATALLGFFYPTILPWGIHEGIFGLMVHIPVLVVVSLLTEAQGGEHVEKFVNPSPIN